MNSEGERMACQKSQARAVVVTLACLAILVNAECLSQSKTAIVDTLMRTLAARGQFSGSVLVAVMLQKLKRKEK